MFIEEQNGLTLKNGLKKTYKIFGGFIFYLYICIINFKNKYNEYV